jgi:hypothetical protein
MYNLIVINVAWYIENSIIEIRNAFDDCLKEYKTQPRFINGEISEDKNLIDEEDWNDGWNPV